jgi:hypothetical protein
MPIEARPGLQVQTGSSGVKVLDLDPRMGGGRSPMAAGGGGGSDSTPTAAEAAGSSGGARASPKAPPHGRTQIGPGQGPTSLLGWTRSNSSSGGMFRI